ncbi:MAG: antibiotic biosynthesis monooxygenase [Candidatus Aminicenantes bacterium]|nr:antibiotic biosynthesis monooxygenase [Candidatus Aminicenantes bacterium]
MYMRLLQVKVKPEGLELARDYYESTVVPRLRTIKGCQFARLIQNRSEPSNIISMTLWENQEDAEAYQKSPVYEQLMAEFSDFLDESSVWKIQLSEKMELEYKPETEEPVIQAFPVTTQKNLLTPETCKPSPLFVRIVSHKIQKGKMGEFRTLYRKEVIPTLEKTRGCCSAYLMENMQNGEEIISITIWENHLAAEDYEKSGQFQHLIDKVKHCYTKLYQWKMALSEESREQAKTSDDMKIDHYKVVSGQEFKSGPTKNRT